MKKHKTYYETASLESKPASRKTLTDYEEEYVDNLMKLHRFCIDNGIEVEAPFVNDDIPLELMKKNMEDEILKFIDKYLPQKKTDKYI